MPQNDNSFCACVGEKPALRKMFQAAFTSRSMVAPQVEQWNERSDNSKRRLVLARHFEQSMVVNFG